MSELQFLETFEIIVEGGTIFFQMSLQKKKFCLRHFPLPKIIITIPPPNFFHVIIRIYFLLKF